MAFGLRMSTGLSDAEIEDRVSSAAELMGIEDLLEKRPGELSGGQHQRVALGRAIVRDPAVFLMDEPVSNLDTKLRAEMRTELQSLQKELETTVIYVTHDQTEAMTMADRIAIMNDGELQQVGTPFECYYEPANRFVAGFIGEPSMNFFEMSVRDGTFRHESFELPGVKAVSGARDSVTLGIRPEDLVVTAGDADDPAAVTATVDVVDPVGDLTYVYLTIDDVSLTATVSGAKVFSPDDTVSVRFPSERVHLFDTETGTAVATRGVPDDQSTADSRLVP